ncbi:MAG: hypothetical protein WC780_10305 [Lentimicrobiaceae bacterium]
MKTCKKCNLSYDDDKMFCKKCGSALISEYNIEPREIAKKAVYEERLKIDSLNVELLHEYAQFLFNNLLLQESISVSLKILALNEKDTEANELLFKSYLKLENYKEAAEIGKQLLVDKPEDIIILENLAKISNNINNKDKAIEYYDKILNLQPTNVSILYKKALVLLEMDSLKDAIIIFERLKESGQNDRITLIYTGIAKALNNEYKIAADLLTSVLSAKEISLKDRDNTRGFLYLAFCLVQLKGDLSEIDQWFSLVDHQAMEKIFNTSDEHTLANTVSYILTNKLNSVKQSTQSKYIIDHLAKTYLFSTENILIKNNSSIYADMWHSVAMKQKELGLNSDAQTSLIKSTELMPGVSKYDDELIKSTVLLKEANRHKKRKTVIVGISIIAVVLITVFSVYSYNLYKESNEWDSAHAENSPESYLDYLNKYPKGNHASEAITLKEMAIWNKTQSINTLIAYFNYLKLYPEGKFSNEAKSKVSNVETIRPIDQIQTLYPRTDPYLFYLPNVGDETHWLNFPDGIKFNYSLRSSDQGFDIIFSDGDVFTGKTISQIPSKSHPSLHFRATTPDQIITMVVTQIY